MSSAITAALAIGSLVTGNISTLNTPNDYQVELTAGTTYQFSMNRSDISLDPTLTLLNRNGTVLEYDNDGAGNSTNPSKNSQLIFTPASSGTYTLRANGLSSTGGYTLSSTTLANDFMVNPVLQTPTLRWGSGPMGTSANITYSFPTSISQTGITSGFVALNDNQKSAVRSLLADISRIVNVTFTEVSGGNGQLRYMANSTLNARGYIGMATGVVGNVVDVQITTNYTNSVLVSSSTLFQKGGAAYFTLLHETGHGLGLKHPGDYGTNSQGGAYLPNSVDQDCHTVMSYNGGTAMTFGEYDLRALYYLYGKPNTNFGSTTYTLGSGNQIIVNSSGTNTIAYSGTKGVTINLNEGQMSYNTNYQFGYASNSLIALASIMPGTKVVNAVGGSGGDDLIGNSLNNDFTGNGGSDRFDGGLGLDVANYNMPKSALSSIYANYVEDGRSWISYNTSQDTFLDVERLRFSDVNVALDLQPTQAAGQAVLFINMLVGRSSLVNATLMGAAIRLLDSMTADETIQYLLNNGTIDALAGSSSDEAFVNLLYRNLIGLEPTSEITNSLLPTLRSSGSRANVLKMVLTSDLNMSASGLSNLMHTGVAYAGAVR